MTGPRLLAAIALAVGGMSAALAIAVTPAPEAAGAVIRWTARTSLVLLLLAYVARPLVALRPSPQTKALLAQRKWIGLGFATSHGLHLAGIIWLASLDWDAFLAARDLSTIVALATFVAIGLMTVTSIDRVRRAMAPRTWRRLHWTGLQLAWFVFATSYFGAAAADPAYVLPAALVAGAGAIRIAAWVKQRRRRAA